MKPRERRDILFKKSKPVFRPGTQPDFGWLWASYELSGGEMEKEEFIDNRVFTLAKYQLVTFIEDENKVFESGKGPVGIIAAKDDGWTVEPHVEWFHWATKKNILRGTVAFLMILRYSKDVGVSLIKPHLEHKLFYKKMKKYVPIYPVGKIPKGFNDGDAFEFYIRGKKEDR